MHATIQTSTQIIAGSMFGSAFVHEDHSDERDHFVTSEGRDFVIGFADILKTLRAALWLRSS